MAPNHPSPTRTRREAGETSPPDGPDKSKFDFVHDFARTWLVSTLLHIALILVLAILTIANATEKIISLEISPNTTEEVQLMSYELEFETEELVDEILEAAQPEDSLAELSSQVEIQHDLGNTLTADNTLKDFGFDGKGFEEVVMDDIAVTNVQFFGAETSGQSFVFVVDNSNSMTKGKFQTALIELDKTISGLNKKQMFYVIFFSDTAYPMFHPKPAKTLIPATKANKARLADWIYEVEMCLKTKGAAAMDAAIRLNPDVIYVLGDGAFTDNTEKLLTATHHRKIVINTLGMQVDVKGMRQLKAIAKANRGSYTNVEASREAIKNARLNPIKRNRARGKVWGVTLPQEENPKK